MASTDLILALNKVRGLIAERVAFEPFGLELASTESKNPCDQHVPRELSGQAGRLESKHSDEAYLHALRLLDEAIQVLLPLAVSGMETKAGDAPVLSRLGVGSRRREEAPRALPEPHANHGEDPSGHGAPVPELPADDLTRIRGIRKPLAEALDKLGVRHFSKIAAWRAVDVARVSAALNLGVTISKQNWIEQAAILAALKEPPGVAVPKASADKPDAQPVAAQPAPALAEFPLPAKSAEATRAISEAVQALVGKVLARCATALDAAPLSTVTDASQQTAPSTQAEAKVDTELAPLNEGVEEPPPVVVAAECPPDRATAEVVSVPRAATPDRLDLIAGIDEETMRKLEALGVHDFKTIANWTSADVASREHELGEPRRIRREGWIEQAALLATGTMTRYARAKGEGWHALLVPRPEPLLEYLPSKVEMAQEPPETTPLAEIGAQAPEVALLEAVPAAAISAYAGPELEPGGAAALAAAAAAASVMTAALQASSLEAAAQHRRWLLEAMKPLAPVPPGLDITPLDAHEDVQREPSDLNSPANIGGECVGHADGGSGGVLEHSAIGIEEKAGLRRFFRALAGDRGRS